MGKPGAVLFLGLTVGAVAAQAVKPYERLLPQWLTGIIAVLCFLFLCFVGMMAKKAWCDGSSRRRAAEAVKENEVVMIEDNGYDTGLGLERNKSRKELKEENSYENTLDLFRVKNKSFDNQAFDNSGERVTSM